MKTNKRSWLAVGVLIGLTVVGGAGAVYSGAYNVAADVPHTRPVYALLETARERSIAVRAARLQVPTDLNDPERIRQGAGNYDAMCTGCHLAPGMAPTEISEGLYPAPPNLTRQPVSVAEAFWVIKHGIKASGMPAWGKRMDDEYIWNMAAFLQQLPKLDQAQYAALVASSGGHSHGGGETEAHGHGDGEEKPHGHGDAAMDDHGAGMPSGAGTHEHPPGTPAHDDGPGSSADAEGRPHAHDAGTPKDHHAPKPSSTATAPAGTAKPAAGSVEHRHADGTVESHPAPAPTAGDGHDDGHQH